MPDAAERSSISSEYGRLDSEDSAPTDPYCSTLFYMSQTPEPAIVGVAWGPDRIIRDVSSEPKEIQEALRRQAERSAAMRAERWPE